MGTSGDCTSFIRRLKMIKPEYLFFVCTCGDDTGRTAQLFSSAVARKGWRCAAGYSVTMPNTYVSLPGFDVDDEDVETQKVHNAVARVRFINEEIVSGFKRNIIIAMKVRFHLLNPIFCVRFSILS